MPSHFGHCFLLSCAIHAFTQSTFCFSLDSMHSVQAGAGDFFLQSRTFGYGLRISTPHTKVAKKIFISTYFVTPRNTAPQDFPRRNLMKRFFPNQKRQQIALAKNQDGARGDDLPNQHKTGTLDCPRRNFAKLFFQSNKYSKSCLRTFSMSLAKSIS